MNHLNKIFSTARQLQASRSFLRDLRGLDKTAEGVEFAKAIGEAAAMGATPEDVVEQVVKAMAGNEAMALEVLESVQEIAKAHIEQHTRTLANGKTVNVKAYETARSAAMKQTTMAHGATFHAMRSKTPEAHENAAAAHTAAAEQHAAAHEVHPMDVPEVGKDHANLKAQHQMSADYHRQEAATMRHGHGYAVQANKAATASQGTKAAITTQQSQMAHQKAAEEHQKAHEFDPSKGHDQQAAMHTAQAQAAQAVNQSMNSPHQGSDVKGAHDASYKAFRATSQAHEGKGLTREGHAAAAKAHEEAINQHMAIHGAKESDEDGHHGQIAKTHMALHAYHSAKAQAKTPEEVAKAQVEGYTRVQDGKVIHVGAYDSKRDAAREASRVAHEASLTAKSKTAHTAAAALHGKAIAAHREAWNVTNHEGRRSMHDANMAEHGDMINAHRAIATAGGEFEDHPLRARAASNLAPDVSTIKPGEEESAAAAHDRAGSAHVTAMDSAGADRSHHSSMADMHAQDARKIREQKGVAKAEGPMTTLGGGTDIATKEGGAALAVEGRPGKEGGKAKKTDGMDYCDACDSAYPEGTEHKCPGSEVAKAHVEAHTRTAGGKVIQVHSYEAVRTANLAGQAALRLHQQGHSTGRHFVQNATLAGNATNAAIKTETEGGDAREAHLSAAKAHETAAASAANVRMKSLAAWHNLAQRAHERAAGQDQHITLPSGHKARYTGETQDLAMGTMHGIETLEGPNAGKKGWVREAPGHTKPEKPNLAPQVAKAHVEQHTRVVGGKTVQVQSYDTHHAAAMKASSTAHAATAQAQNPQHHAQAAATHMKAAEGHREAAKYAPEDWQKKGHEDNAKLHEHYAQAHHAKAKAGDQRADTGVDTPQHTPQDLKELENHDDYQGFGYLGHEGRTQETDRHLAEAANKAGLSKHELAAHVLSKSGRHMMDDHSHLSSRASDAEKVAHFQRHLTSPKTEKEYGVKAYAKDLEERAPKKAEPAKEPVTVRAADPEKGHALPKKPISKEEREAVGKWSERRQGESEDDHFKRVPHLERGGGDDRNESEDAYFDRQHGARKEAMDKESAAKPATEETLHGKALEGRAPKKAEPAKPAPGAPSSGGASKPSISREEREAVGKWSERRSGESEDDHFKRVPHLERGGGDDRNESEDDYFDRQHHARKEAMDKEGAGD